MRLEFPEYQETKPALLIKKSLDLILEPGAVFEVRIPKTKMGTIAGYFNDTTIAATIIARENGRHQAVYVTANPVNPALFARSNNKLEFGTQVTTNDADIARRRWFLMDFDPVRPTGISSTAEELQWTWDMANTVVEWLRSIGWPEPLVASSGNGVHVMFRTDEPNDEAARIDFECALKMLSSMFSDHRVKVDVTVFNAARIWKIYGTVSAKGANTDERPHRVAMIESVPKEWELLSRDLLSAMAAPIRDAKPEEFQDMTGEYIQDMVKWLTERDQKVVSGPRPMFGNEGQKWIIASCPFNPDHQNPMVGLVNNRPVFKCLHDSCSAFKWKEFREEIDPTYKDPDTVLTRLKEWCEDDSAEPDQELVQNACRLGTKKMGEAIKDLKKTSVRSRVLLLEDHIKREQKRFRAAVVGDNNEKGNVVGLINRARAMQDAGAIPMFWIADYDHRVRVGKIGDITAPKQTSTDEIALLVRFHSQGDSWVKQTHCYQVIQFLAEEHRVNPLRVHLKSLRWDGTPRLSSWLADYCGTKDTDYTKSIGRKWLISAVARAMDPGCQADHMLILEGAQGIGKSQALRALGGGFYCEFAGSMTGQGTQHKDMVAVMQGKMVVEMSELSTIRRGDMEVLKAVLTTTHDDVRLSYERDAKTYPRTCVFAGTTNEVGQSYIADTTGIRRFWPTWAGEVKVMNIPGLKDVRDDLWAEAVEAYEAGEDWYSVPKELVAEEQGMRQVTLEQSEPWFYKVRQCMTDSDSFANGVLYIVPKFVNGQEIDGQFNVRAGSMYTMLGILLGIDTARQTQNDVQRLQKVLRGIGFKKVRPSRNWIDSTYAYDISEEVIPHLWPAIKAAHASMAFPKPSKVDKDQGEKA